MRVDEALKLIRSKRPYAEPNMGFMRQLREFEREMITRPDSMNKSTQKFSAAITYELSNPMMNKTTEELIQEL